MKICVTAQGKDLNARVDPRFGRCPYFIIVDPQTLEFEAIENSSVAAGSGAGIQSGQLMANKAVEVLLAGNIGPNAFTTLQAAGIRVITGVTGTVQDAVLRFNKGEFKEVSAPTVASKFGISDEQTQTSPTPDQLQGSGFSPGMSPGMPGWQQPMPGMYPPGQVSKQQQLQMLKNQIDFLRQQMESIAKSIDELSKE